MIETRWRKWKGGEMQHIFSTMQSFILQGKPANADVASFWQ